VGRIEKDRGSTPQFINLLDLLGDGAFLCHNVRLRLCSCCLSWFRVIC